MMKATPIPIGFLLGSLLFNPNLVQTLIGLIWLATAIEVDFKPIRNWIALHKERIQNRRQYELFKSGVKDGLFTTDEQMERENRRIIK